MVISEKDLERFWSKVVKTENCWEWAGTIAINGYGIFHLNKKGIRAHRVVYQLCKSDIPFGLIVMHSCDNRKCVNPSHLSVGTYEDNLRDASAKGRMASNRKGKKLGPLKPTAKRPWSLYKTLLDEVA